MVAVLTESTILGQRHLKKIVRVPTTLFVSLFQPALWLLLFPQIFQRVGEFAPFRVQGFDSYLMFFVPTVLTMTALTSAFLSGMGMVADVNSGIIEKFLISPVHRSSLLFSKVMVDGFRLTVQGVLILAVALLMGARIATGVGGAVIMLVVVSLLGVAWAGLSNLVALRTRRADATMMTGWLTFPLLFMSTAWVPPGLLPGWLDTVAGWNPVTYVIETARQLMNFGYDWPLILKTVGLIVAGGALTLTAATRALLRLAR